jgi:hypothetical protein
MKKIIGYAVVGEHSFPVWWWGKYEWSEPFQKCITLETNIYSQRKMAERMKDTSKEKVVKVRITIEELK